MSLIALVLIDFGMRSRTWSPASACQKVRAIAIGFVITLALRILLASTTEPEGEPCCPSTNGEGRLLQKVERPAKNTFRGRLTSIDAVPLCVATHGACAWLGHKKLSVRRFGPLLSKDRARGKKWSPGQKIFSPGWHPKDGLALVGGDPLKQTFSNGACHPDSTKDDVTNHVLFWAGGGRRPIGGRVDGTVHPS